jgi:hypothetical protein
MQRFIESLESRQLLSVSAPFLFFVGPHFGSEQTHLALRRVPRVRPPALAVGTYNGMAKIVARTKHVRMPSQSLSIQITKIEGSSIEGRVLSPYFTGGLGELFLLTGQVTGKTFTLQGGQYNVYGDYAGINISVAGKAKGRRISGTITVRNDLPYVPVVSGKFKAGM